jgi:hypothetical protein
MMKRKVVIALLVFMSVGIAQAGLVADFQFNEGSGTTTADSSATGATGTLSSGVSWSAGGVQYNGTTGRIDAPAPGKNWDGVYWSSAPQFQMSWDLDIKTSVTPDYREAILMFGNTGVTTTHIRGNKLLLMQTTGKLALAGNSIVNNSSGKPTTDYSTTNSFNDGLQHHVKVLFDINASGVNDTVTIFVDGVSELVLPGFDWNASLVDQDISGWSAPGMIFGFNKHATSATNWNAYSGWMDNVQINTIPEPATMTLLGLGLLLARRK